MRELKKQMFFTHPFYTQLDAIRLADSTAIQIIKNNTEFLSGVSENKYLCYCAKLNVEQPEADVLHIVGELP